MSRKADQSARIEARLEEVTVALDSVRQRLSDAVLARLTLMDDRTADLAHAVQVVMAARAETGDTAGCRLADVLAEVRAVRDLVTPARPVPPGPPGGQPRPGKGGGGNRV